MKPDQAHVGLLVRVRRKPIVVAEVTYACPRPVEGVIHALDKSGRGAWVMTPKHGGLFAAWDEMERRRAKEGET